MKNLEDEPRRHWFVLEDTVILLLFSPQDSCLMREIMLSTVVEQLYWHRCTQDRRK